MSTSNFLRNDVFHVPNHSMSYVDEQLKKVVEPNTISGEVLKPTFYFVAGEENARGKAYLQGRYITLRNLGDNKLITVDGLVFWNGTNDSANGGFLTGNNAVMKDLDNFSIIFSMLYVGSASVWNGQDKLLEGIGGSDMFEFRIAYESGNYKLIFYMGGDYHETEGFKLPDNLNMDTRILLGIVKNGATITCYVNGEIVSELNNLGGATGVNPHSGMMVYTLKGGGMMNSVALFDGQSLTASQMKKVDFRAMMAKPAYMEGIREGFYSYA